MWPLGPGRNLRALAISCVPQYRHTAPWQIANDGRQKVLLFKPLLLSVLPPAVLLPGSCFVAAT